MRFVRNHDDDGFVDNFDNVDKNLVEENSSFDGFSTNRAFGHSISAHLAGSVATKEDHVLQPVQTNGTHGLKKRESSTLHRKRGHRETKRTSKLVA